MTTRTSRPPSAAWHASSWPGRNSGKPKNSRRAGVRSTAASVPALAAGATGCAQVVTERAERSLRNHLELLEGELPVRVLGALEGVVPGEAGVAVGLPGGADCLVHAVQGEVGQGV